MKWIGLTGGIASGKSTVANLLKERGYPVVDADELARAVVEVGEAGLTSVVSHFGNEVLLSNGGGLDRQKLADIVFKNPAQLQVLGELLHPLVKAKAQDARRNLEAQGVAVAFYDVPLLFEKNMEADFDAIVVVACSQEQQVARLRARNNMSRLEAEYRIAAQAPLLEKIGKAHFVVRNEGDVASLNGELLKLDHFIVDSFIRK